MAETARASFPVVDKFVSSVKKFFKKSPKRLFPASIIRQLHQVNKNFAVFLNALNEIENTLSVPDIISMLNRIRDNIGDPASMKKIPAGSRQKRRLYRSENIC